MKMGSIRPDAGVAQLVEHELPKLGVAGSNPVARSSFPRGILCEAAHLTVIRVPHFKYRCRIKRNDISDAVKAQKASMLAEVEEGKNYFWCACGKSAEQSFCDGSYKDTGISPVKYTAEASKKVFFCGCKQSERHRYVTVPTANYKQVIKN